MIYYFVTREEDIERVMATPQRKNITNIVRCGGGSMSSRHFLRYGKLEKVRDSIGLQMFKIIYSCIIVLIMSIGVTIVQLKCHCQRYYGAYIMLLKLR